MCVEENALGFLQRASDPAGGCGPSLSSGKEGGSEQGCRGCGTSSTLLLHRGFSSACNFRSSKRVNVEGRNVGLLPHDQEIHLVNIINSPVTQTLLHSR